MKNKKALSILANCLEKLENLSMEEVETIRKEKNINEYDFIDNNSTDKTLNNN